MTMLETHLDNLEDNLISQSKIPSISGHSLHKGTPRESFINLFLETHISSNIAIGTGEIIDSQSSPGGQRNQYDFVLYKRNYPKINFGGNIDAFLIESVVATIEVKSTLDAAGIEQSIRAAHAAKSLIPNQINSMRIGWIPPKVLNFIVAYDGPANMSTVHNWILSSHRKLNIPLPHFIQSNRLGTAGTALDGTFVLKKGFVKLDNTPLSLSSNNNNSTHTHIVSDSSSSNLLTLFLTLQSACDHLQGAWLDVNPYIKTVNFPNIKFV